MNYQPIDKIVAFCRLAAAALLLAINAVGAHGEVHEVNRLALAPRQTHLRESAPNPARRNTHPMAAVIRFASDRYNRVASRVQDFTCVLVKRERVNGRLGEHEWLDMRVRCRRVRNGRVVTPQSIYARWLAPTRLENRQLLYVAGRNDDKMLVRRGGQRFSYVTVSVSLFGEQARAESNFPITESDVVCLSRRLIYQAYDEMRLDPQGTNTKVSFINGAKVDGRVCTLIRILHPRRQAGLPYHRANIFIDDELLLPIRVEAYDWPDQAGGSPPLIEECTYQDLRLNVGLSDAHFHRDVFIRGS
jgi:hypothetical protein